MKTYAIQTRIDEEINAAIEAYCKENPEISRSAVLRMALKDWEPLRKYLSK